ncbi:apoptosis inhibitory protein 5-domain-containing protein [Vararia minispora EC-137]|uniref:Apoptosis inhibitory protein 5-domain-containing protein n=1 Tax=Vararia minispora EC-137 TaxID=1314806 RepID=A0ACB8QM36_9AGAM|nr:apoptosis inhibitory protein 5-domain-containing protein [Vararia minispora EC-137]
MDAAAVENERETREFIRRAERTPLPTSSVRREALEKLIDLSRVSQAPLKKLAADNITKFLKGFPDLEEDAINAVYDLCEDNDPGVRMNGYRAIVQMSKEQSKWIKRNADVLVQLLQSEEADEVVFVKKALASHLDMDSKVTLGVLCDQIAPAGEPADEDERITRERLRSLVLNFMCVEHRRAIVERHASRAGSEQEKVLIDGLFRAIDRFDVSLANRVVKEILVYLPSFKGRPYVRGNDLVTRLLKRAEPLLDADLNSRSEYPALSVQTREYLNLALYVCVERSAASSAQVLDFYGTRLNPPELLKLSPDSKLFLLVQLAEAWGACDASEIDRDRVRRHVSDCATLMLPGFVKMGPHDERPWKAMGTHAELFWEALAATWSSFSLTAQPFPITPSSTLDTVRKA